MTKLKELLIGGCSPDGDCAQIVYAVYRAGVGLAIALLHGIEKLPPPEQLVGFIGSKGFPVPILWAWGATLTEFAGGLCIAIGLCTRFSAMMLGIVMLTAFVVFHGAAFKGENPGELAFLFFLMSLPIAAFGSGKWGVDRFLRERITCC